MLAAHRVHGLAARQSWDCRARHPATWSNDTHDSCKSRLPRLLRVGLMIGLSLALGGAAAQDIIKARQGNFRVLSKNMQEVVKGLGNGVPIGELRPSILAAQRALDRIPSLFPPGSDRGRTRALPLIWSDPVLFKQTYVAAADRMTQLVATAQGNDRDAFGSAVGRMAAACGTCHSKFRSDRPN